MCPCARAPARLSMTDRERIAEGGQAGGMHAVQVRLREPNGNANAHIWSECEPLNPCCRATVPSSAANTTAHRANPRALSPLCCFAVPLGLACSCTARRSSRSSPVSSAAAVGTSMARNLGRKSLTLFLLATKGAGLN